MLRLSTLILIITILALAFLSLLSPRITQSGPVLRRITRTPETAINLNPSLSDDGSAVAFESTLDLALVGGGSSFHCLRVDARNALTAFVEVARTRCIAPSLSHDGSKVTFASNEDLLRQNPDRNSEIYLSDASALTQITGTTPGSPADRLHEGNFRPSLSSDGHFVTFTSNRDLAGLNADHNDEVFLFDNLTRIFTQITSTSAPLSSSNAKISGDGSRIAFIMSETTSEQIGDLMIYERATGESRRLTTRIPGLSFSEGRAISNDGQRIVYSAETGLNQSQVFVFDLPENNSRQLTTLGTRATDVRLQPTISGDGRRISFATRRRVTNPSDGSVELYLLDLPTGQFQQITEAPASATGEVLSSLNLDGSLVAFNFPRVLSEPVSDNDLANNSEIYLASVASRPAFGVATAVNAATNGNEPQAIKALAPESLVSVKGNALASGAVQATLSPAGQFPFSLGGTTASANGLPSQLVYVSSNEVVLVLPASLSEGPAELVLTNSDGFQTKASAIITRAAPGVFTLSGDGRGGGVVINADSFVESALDPTDGRLRLVVFASGVRHAASLAAEIAGEEALVEGVSPANVPGLDEVHLLVPSALRGVGVATLLLKADGNESNPVTLKLDGSSLRDIVINEFLADPPDGLEGDANHDGTRSASADEFVELVNATTRDLDLGGYELLTRSTTATAATLRHKFSERTILSAGTAIVIFGGGNPDVLSPVFGGANIARASSGSLSLGNTGGLITLRDSAGSVVSSVTYGPSAGLIADSNQSLTRAPDVTGGLTLHSLAAGSNMKLFSPGTRFDATPFLPAPPVSVVMVSPTKQNLLVGADAQFTARAFDSNNRELDQVLFKWQSSAPSVVNVNAAGVAKALGPGVAQIIATARGVSSTPAEVTVTQPPTPTPTPTPSPEPTPLPSPTPTLSPSPSPTATATPTPVSSPSPLPSPSPSPLPRIVISEFRTRGPNGASDEFIEVYNAGDAAVNISGWKLKGSNGSGSISTRLTISTGTVIPPRGHFLAAHSQAYSGNVPADQTYTSGITNDGGVALTLEDDTPVDQVGLSAGSAFKEGMHLAPLPADANQSYERKPGGLNGGGVDTNDNFSDFQLLTPSEPQNLSSHPTPGPTPTPTPSPTPVASPSPRPSPSPSPLPTPQGKVVISQIFGGGGNSGAPYRNDFVELFNSGQSAVDLAEWSVQYASATASTWSVTNLTPVVLAPGQHYLIQEASGGGGGIGLPTPDVSGTIAMAATAGKVALVRATTVLSGPCPGDSTIVDLVGYGATANCFRGSAPAPAPGNTTALLRGENGCSDHQNNPADFAAGTPTPRNTTASITLCASPLLSTLFDRNPTRWLSLLFIKSRRRPWVSPPGNAQLA